MKGEPVTGFEKGTVYVVEFWATWCGPCISSMPHLSELQKEYKDKGVTIIGTNIWEDREYNDKTYAKAEKFMKEGKGKDIMNYTVAFDGAAKVMETTYMRAAGQNGIPCAFIVDKEGRVAYIGHPMNMDEPLAQIVAGNYDLEKAKADYAKAEAEEAEMAKKSAERQGELGKLIPIMQSFEKSLEAKDYDKAYDAAKKLLDSPANKNAQMMNALAWGIVDPEANVEKKDLDIALKAANYANDAAKGKDGAILDTLARVHFLKGDTAKAIELQTKAVELAPDEMKEDLKKSLEEFKAKK
jgi:thiol-disulfide isomerase/thioredoxin